MHSEIKKIALDGSNKKESPVCPKHLLNKKEREIKSLIEKGNLFEAISIMQPLIKDYGKDYNVARLIATNYLKVLIKDEKEKNNEILNYLINKYKHNFFDYILGIYVLGISLLIDTDIEEKEIIQNGLNLSTMSPKRLKSLLDILPKDKIYQKNAFERIIKTLK